EKVQLDLDEKPVLGAQLLSYLGNPKTSTLALYRKQGMPYIKGHPNRYLIPECVAWYNENRKMHRRNYNH
ncbi:MAG: hypothetical protein ACRC2M_21770, partial [Planktothrix sp.]